MTGLAGGLRTFGEKPRGPRKSGFLDDNLEVVGGGLLALPSRIVSQA
jgi:hypothetical protein